MRICDQTAKSYNDNIDLSIYMSTKNNSYSWY